MKGFKKISCKYVISKLATQFKLSDSGWHGEAIEYIGEAIKGIGYHTGFESVTGMPLMVKNYKVKIPCNLESIETIWYDCCPLLLAYDRDKFHKRNLLNLKNSYVATYEDILEYNKTVDRIVELKKEIQEETLNPLNPDLTKMQAMEQALTSYYQQLVTIGRTNCLGDNCNLFRGQWYMIENDYIKTSFESGIIHIDGNTIGLDSDGYPLVVDTFKYLTALEWYVRYQMLLSGYALIDINWMQANQMWEDARQKAANEPKIMGIDDLTSLVHSLGALGPFTADE